MDSEDSDHIGGCTADLSRSLGTQITVIFVMLWPIEEVKGLKCLLLR